MPGSSMKLRKNIIASLVLAVALGLSLTACQDTKTRQENEQLKAQVSQLEKDNGDLQNHVDALTQENAELKQENERLKAKKVKTKKTAKHKHRSSAKASSPNWFRYGSPSIMCHVHIMTKKKISSQTPAIASSNRFSSISAGLRFAFEVGRRMNLNSANGANQSLPTAWLTVRFINSCLDLIVRRNTFAAAQGKQIVPQNNNVLGPGAGLIGSWSEIGVPGKEHTELLAGEPRVLEKGGMGTVEDGTAWGLVGYAGVRWGENACGKRQWRAARGDFSETKKVMRRVS
jgi:regulator of replication initiation timing